MAAALLSSVGAMLALAACDRLGGKSITVQFRNAGGIQSGDTVYLSGVRIGTTGNPVVVSGRARVPVHLSRQHREAVPRGTVFLAAPDPTEPQRTCLIGYPGGAAAAPSEAEEAYNGASNQIELAILIGTEKARQVWNELAK